MTEKITLPMDVSRGIQFDFTVEGITEEQAKALLDQIQAYMYPRGLVMAGGFASVAHMEELEQERKEKEGNRIKALIDIYRSGDDSGEWLNDDISLDDIEEWEDEFDADGMPYDLSDYEY